jgi:chromate reductase
MGASTGVFGAVWAQAELRKALRHAGARVLDEELPVALAGDAFAEDGRLASLELDERLRDLTAALVREAAAPLEVFELR